jgi:hypothetical protein
MKMQEKCDRNEETHALPVAILYRGKGCTKAEAEACIIAQLLDNAISLRKKSCEKCACEGEESGACITSIDDDDLQKITSSISYFCYKKEGCPKGVGWTSRVTVMKYRSICICVPK